MKAKNKVYIVDEVHMLTNEAFNAILKTLEEPPDNVFFIFCTTNPEKIPDTVLSRLTRINFPGASNEEVMGSLRRVVEGEKIKIKPDLLRIIAQSAEGSFRDAHKILYQLYLKDGQKITRESVEEVLNFWQESVSWYLLGFLADRKLQSALETLERLSARGIDWSLYGKRLLESIKDLFLLKAGLEVSDSRAKDLLPAFTQIQLKKLVEIFSKALDEARYVPIPQLPFQTAVVEFLVGEDSGSKKNHEEKEKINIASKKDKITDKEDKKVVLRSQKADCLISLEDLQEKWPAVLEAVKPMNHSVNALLHAARPKVVNGEQITLEVFYQFHKDQLELDRNKKIVQEAVNKVFQTFLQIKCELGEKPKENTTATNNLSSSPKPQQKDNSDSDKEDLYEIAKDIFGE